MNNIYLIGFMGAGKTAVARTLSEMTKKEKVDTDDIITKRVGKSISDIFSEDGEEYFRKVEREVVSSLTAENDLSCLRRRCD